MNQIASPALYTEGRMHQSGSNAGNILLYLATLTGTFLVENWYLVIMVVFGGIHAYAAWRKHKREEQEAEYRKKDRELLLAREEERMRLESELLKKQRQKERDNLLIAEKEKKRNREHYNKRADLYCEHPEKRRNTLTAIGGDDEY